MTKKEIIERGKMFTGTNEGYIHSEYGAGIHGTQMNGTPATLITMVREIIGNIAEDMGASAEEVLSVMMTAEALYQGRKERGEHAEQ